MASESFDHLLRLLRGYVQRENTHLRDCCESAQVFCECDGNCKKYTELLRNDLGIVMTSITLTLILVDPCHFSADLSGSIIKNGGKSSGHVRFVIYMLRMMDGCQGTKDFLAWQNFDSLQSLSTESLLFN